MFCPILPCVCSKCTLVWWSFLHSLWFWHHRQPHPSVSDMLFMLIVALPMKSVQCITLHLSVFCLCHCRHVITGRRTIGKVTSYSAMHTTHTLSNMSPHSRQQNWVCVSAIFLPPSWHVWFDCTADANLGFVYNIGRTLLSHFIYISVAGRLVWRRHPGVPLPSHHSIRGTCTQLLPLLEMYCKWELQEDCSNLQSLMVRYDSERELQSHGLGRSLLFMIRDEDLGFETMPRTDVLHAAPNPFDDIRERLVAADLAIRDLHGQVFLPHICSQVEVCIEFQDVHSNMSCTPQPHWEFYPYDDFASVHIGFGL